MEGKALKYKSREGFRTTGMNITPFVLPEKLNDDIGVNGEQVESSQVNVSIHLQGNI